MSGETVKVKLRRPIPAHDTEVSELDLREPTAAEVGEIGYPYLVLMRDGQDTAIELRANVAMRYISRLAGIPTSSVNKLSIADLSELQGVVMGFFGEQAAAQ